MPCDIKRRVRIWILQVHNEYFRIGNRYGARLAVPDQIRLVEVWSATKEQALTLQLGVLGRELTVFRNRTAVVIRS
jgi:hypothetical protein